MSDLNLISFSINVKGTHDMEYSCDSKKDKPLQGHNFEVPIVKLEDKLCRSGCLKVVSVAHNSVKHDQDLYHLHPNLLCGDPKGVNHCNDVGVASYKFENKTGIVLINLENLCIRHSRKNSVDCIKKKWLNSPLKFDPFSIGFGDTDNLDYQKIRLCCQIFFSDNTKSNIILSDCIFNGPSDIKIEYWDEKREVKSNCKNELLYALVRKVSTEQRKIFARFFDNLGWEKRVEPEHNQHDYTFVFKIPPYKNELINEEVICYFQLSVKDKEFYKSETKQFCYIPVSNKKQFDSEEINIIQSKNNFENQTELDVQCVKSSVENLNSKKVEIQDTSNKNLIKTPSLVVKKRKMKESTKESMKKILISSTSLFKNFFTEKSTNEVDDVIGAKKMCFRDQRLPFKKYLTAKYQTDNSSEIKQNKRKYNQKPFGKNGTHFDVVNNDLTPISVEFLTKQNTFFKKIEF